MSEPEKDDFERINDFLGANPWWCWGIALWLILAFCCAVEGFKWLLR